MAETGGIGLAEVIKRQLTLTLVGEGQLPPRINWSCQEPFPQPDAIARPATKIAERSRGVIPCQIHCKSAHLALLSLSARLCRPQGTISPTRARRVSAARAYQLGDQSSRGSLMAAMARARVSRWLSVERSYSAFLAKGFSESRPPRSASSKRRLRGWRPGWITLMADQERGLSAQLERFFNALQDVGNNPTSIP